MSRWKSNLGFIFATTGAAVGLGNIWKFAYMAGSSGGSAFVLVYLLCVALVGVPLMIAEMLLGRLGRFDAVTSLQNLAIQYNKSRHWQLLGWLGMLILFLVLSFYSVVAGWSIFYIVQILQHGVTGIDMHGWEQIWSNLLATPKVMFFYHAIFMFLTLYVVARGIQEGIEKAAKIMMPLLFAILIVVLFYAMHISGFNAGLNFLFHFDITKITPNVAIAALGHAFFTLAIGAGCILIYGAYLPDKTRIGSTVMIITFLDVLVAILTGIGIFSIVFTYHVPVTAGPGLMFISLPIAFAKMQYGLFFGLLFFSLLLFAAWTSSISLAEPLVAMLVKKRQWSRLSSCMVIGVLSGMLGGVILLSFNYLKDFKPLFDRDIFTLITDTTTNILLPIGGVCFAIFVGYKVPLKKLQQQLSSFSPRLFSVWLFLLKYVVILGVLIVLIEGVI